MLSFIVDRPRRRSGTGPLPHPWRQPPSNLPLGFQLLDLGDRARRVQALGTRIGTVPDRVAAIEAERVLELVEAFAGQRVAAVGEPALGLEQVRGAEDLVAFRHIAREAHRAAGAEEE